MKLFRSVLAVLVGVVTIVVLSIATDKILEAAGIFPPPTAGLFETWMLVMALTYRSIYAVVGGYVTALLAPSLPVRHAIILGAIGIVASTLGAIQAWDMSPHWYPISLIVTALPCTWLGGTLQKK
jgi:hypothetical protein